MPFDQMYPHTPVLEREVISYLKPASQGKYLDATLGAGGHAEAILSASQPDGLLLGLDVDASAITIAEKRLQKYSSRLFLFHASYTDMENCLQKIGWDVVDGIFFDLGFSSRQVDEA